MGSNRRYGDSLDSTRVNRDAERRIAKLVRLDDAQLDLEHDPPRRADRRLEVRAWVTFEDGRTARVIGTAREWTSKAVHVFWSVGEGDVRDAWVWASAVEKL